MKDPATILDVRGLHVALPFPGGGEPVEVVRGVSFSVRAGGFHALVGESGCGKSVTAMAVGRLPPASEGRISGEVLFRGGNLLLASARDMRAARGAGGISFVFQDPMSALNPVLSVRTQLREALAPGTPRREGDAFLAELLAEVGLPDARRIFRSHPCELSGGMAQRVCLAMALAQKPALLVADEPTTALDVIVQRKVLDLLRESCRARGVAVLLITHNLALVSRYAETVSVLYAGRIVEDGPVREVLSAPAHPYTAALLRAVPRLEGRGGVEDLATIPGRVPPPREWASLPCAFAPRCPFAEAACRTDPPPWRTLFPARRVLCGRPFPAGGDSPLENGGGM